MSQPPYSGLPPAGTPSPGTHPYGPPPQPLSPADERTWATLGHIAPLVAMAASAGLLGFVGSLAIYLLFRERGPFVRQHAANSLNIQIITFIVMVVSVPLMFILIGFLTYAAAFVFAFILHIVAAVKAHQGEWFQPPLTPAFVR